MAIQVGVAVKNGKLTKDARYEILETLEELNASARRLKEFKVTVDWQALDSVHVRVVASGENDEQVIGEGSAKSVIEALDSSVRQIRQQVRQQVRQQAVRDEPAPPIPAWVSYVAEQAAAASLGIVAALVLFFALSYEPMPEEEEHFVVREEASEFMFPVMLMGKTFYKDGESYKVNLEEMDEDVTVHETLKNEEDGTFAARISFILSNDSQTKHVEVEAWVKYNVKKVAPANGTGIPIAMFPVQDVETIRIEYVES